MTTFGSDEKSQFRITDESKKESLLMESFGENLNFSGHIPRRVDFN